MTKIKCFLIQYIYMGPEEEEVTKRVRSAWTVGAIVMNCLHLVLSSVIDAASLRSVPRTLQNVINLSSCRSSRTFQTIMSLTVDHLASCKHAQTVGASSFGLYPPLFLFVVQLFASLHYFFDLAISLPKYVCNTSSQMQVVFFHPFFS